MITTRSEMGLSFVLEDRYGVWIGVPTQIISPPVRLFHLSHDPADASYIEFGNMQYLAVTTMPHIETRPSLGVKWPQTTPGAIQIWSVKKADADGEDKDKGGGEMKCEMVLCVDGGRGMEVRWMPLGAWDEVRFGSMPIRQKADLHRWTGRRSKKMGYRSWVSLLWPSWMDRSHCTPYHIPKPCETFREELQDLQTSLCSVSYGDLHSKT